MGLRWKKRIPFFTSSTPACNFISYILSPSCSGGDTLVSSSWGAAELCLHVLGGHVECWMHLCWALPLEVRAAQTLYRWKTYLTLECYSKFRDKTFCTVVKIEMKLACDLSWALFPQAIVSGIHRGAAAAKNLPVSIFVFCEYLLKRGASLLCTASLLSCRVVCNNNTENAPRNKGSGQAFEFSSLWVHVIVGPNPNQ